VSSRFSCPDAAWSAYARRYVRCKRRCCPGCGSLWARDQRQKLIQNVGHVGEPVALVTITSPGRDAFPDGAEWWRERELYAWWLDKALAQLERVKRAAVARAQRRARAAGASWKVIGWTKPQQKRGAVHVHEVVPMGTPALRRISQLYADELAARLEGGKKRAPQSPCKRRCGFTPGGSLPLWGFVDTGRMRGGVRRLVARESNSAGRYVGRHLAGQRDGRNELLEAARDPALARRRLVHVHPELTRRPA